MASGPFRFGTFLIDPDNRRLTRDGEPVELNARYLDALALLVREAGRLVSKGRFLDEVWRGVPVTDEALTQCVRTLRRQLGDDAARPRFIETVPKHGYRFIAPVEPVTSAGRAALPPPHTSSPDRLRRFLALAAAGTLGGGVAGLIGGLFYGFAGAAQQQPGTGAISVLIVLVFITVLLALAGAAGVSLGIASAEFASPHRSALSRILGGALGGIVVGALVKLVGLDAFSLLVGQTPGDITGAPEGALLGASVGLGAYYALREEGRAWLRRGVSVAGLAGAAGGLAISLSGGRLLGGSLDLFARDFPASRLRLDQIGAIFGETGLGPVSHAFTSILEGALFGACVVGAMILARRRMTRPAAH